MATKNSSSSQSKSTTTRTRTSSSSRSGISLNKVAFYTLVVAAILYLVAMILSLIDLNAGTVITVLQNIALAIMVVIVSILSWRYVSHKPMVWKVLYVVVLLVIIAGIIVPLIK